MYVSIEAELPAYMRDGSGPVLPDRFQKVWEAFAGAGWTRDQFGAHRDVPNDDGFLKASQAVSTDAGPLYEIATSPARSIGEIEIQLAGIRDLSLGLLAKEGIGLLGCGVHPFLGTTDEEYYRFRTPRTAYDYAIRERGWTHKTMVNIAATQEIVDLRTDEAPRAIEVMHRLAGLIIFLCRNDPDFGRTGAILSVRPKAWRDHVPTGGRFAGDRDKVWLPENPIDSWKSYLTLLWDTSPMFVLGTKNDGAVYVPEHPTFWRFLTEAPAGGWSAKRMVDGTDCRIVPEWSHLDQSDWPYMGLSRLRWKWNPGDDGSLDALKEAYRRGGTALDGFLGDRLKKVVLENRSTAAAPPGEELASLALVAGLMANLPAALEFARRRSYCFWLEVALASEIQPMDSRVEGTCVTALLDELVGIAEAGLVRRGHGHGERGYLAPLKCRIRDRLSPSERAIALFRSKGMDATIRRLSY